MFAHRICCRLTESILPSTSEMFPVPQAATQVQSMIDKTQSSYSWRGVFVMKPCNPFSILTLSVHQTCFIRTVKCSFFNFKFWPWSLSWGCRTMKVIFVCMLLCSRTVDHPLESLVNPPEGLLQSNRGSDLPFQKSYLHYALKVFLVIQTSTWPPLIFLNDITN